MYSNMAAIVLLNHDPGRKKTAYFEDFMKRSVIEGNICGLNLRRGVHSTGHYFQDGRHFSCLFRITTTVLVVL